MQTILQLFSWYALFLIGGFSFWLAFEHFFPQLKDKGYAISKVLFFVIYTLIIWLLGFIFKIKIDNASTTFFYILLIALFFGYFFLKKKKFPEVEIKAIVIVEIVLVLASAFGLFVSSIHPTMDNSTERMMDFMILNSNTTNDTLPAKDLWFSGNSINYYYYGPYFFSVINKVTNTNAYDGYALGIGLIFGLVCMVIFSLVYTIKRSIFAGIVGVGLTMFFSNFDYIYRYVSKYLTINPDQTFKFITSVIVVIALESFLYMIFVYKNRKLREYFLINILLFTAYFFVIGGFGAINGLFNYVHNPNTPITWFWDHSRVIPYTINEFPYYSLMVGDFHPHYIDLIFFTTLLTLLFLEIRILSPELLNRLYCEKFSSILKRDEVKNLLFIKLCMMLVFSVGIATNSWELIFLAFFFFVKDIVFICRLISHAIDTSDLKRKMFFKIMLTPLLLDLAVGLGAVILQIPFLKSISPPVDGIKFNSQLSTWPEFLIFWIVFFIFIAIGLTFLFKKLYVKNKLSSREYFILTLFITSICLIIFCEFFYLADLFYFENFTYRRANTVFKLYYYSYVMLGIASTWTLFRLFKETLKKPKINFKHVVSRFLLVFIAIALLDTILILFYYVPSAISQWSSYNQSLEARYSLNSYDQTKKLKKDVVNAAEYLKSVKKDRDVLLEAPGAAYTFSSIGATYSTIPNVLGWETHEAQWRRYVQNQVPKLIETRKQDVTDMFNKTGLQSKELMKKYGITYIWIGDVEREKFGSDILTHFQNDTSFKQVYANSTITIFSFQ